ncbi:MAG: hypothetical protein ISS31_00445 [Kiritimatiellae bacterium]|nr:hypothetical protein [Kiritimatiellia bacterium]
MNYKKIILQSFVLTALCVGIALAAVQPGQQVSRLAKLYATSGAEISTGANGETVVDFASRKTTYRNVPELKAGANLGVASGAFVGNYVEAGIVSLKFKIATDGHVPDQFSVILVHGTKTWYTGKVTISSEPGVWVQNEVGFDRADDEWFCAQGASDLSLAWQQALNDVDALGVYITPEVNRDAQQFMIKDFVLVDSNGTEHPGELSPLGAALWARFRAARIADVGAAGGADSDGDGVSDLDETLTGTDADDKDSRFVAEVVELLEDGVKIQWASAVDWASYNVFRSTGLTEGFALVGDGLTLADLAVVDGMSVWVDTSADPDGGPYFYRVVSVIEEE